MIIPSLSRLFLGTASILPFSLVTEVSVLDIASNTSEFNELDNYIDHWRDMNFSYAAVKQLEGKYLVQNRVSNHHSFAYIAI